jgi:DNA-binding response OmpR family regulator
MKTILIVDDESLICDVLTAALKNEYNVISANNGKAGLELFIQHRPDLIITVCYLPLMTGLEMINNIRKNDREVVIIAYDTFLKLIDKQLMMEAGANICLDKPLGIAELKRLITAMSNTKLLMPELTETKNLPSAA